MDHSYALLMWDILCLNLYSGCYASCRVHTGMFLSFLNTKNFLLFVYFDVVVIRSNAIIQ